MGIPEFSLPFLLWKGYEWVALFKGPRAELHARVSALALGIAAAECNTLNIEVSFHFWYQVSIRQRDAFNMQVSLWIGYTMYRFAKQLHDAPLQ